MKKIFIGIVIIVVFFTFSLIFSACNENNLPVEPNDSHTTETQPATNNTNGMTRHEVSLNLNNYLTYLNVTESQYNGDTIPRFTFSGCLSYAFYDNVIVTINYQGYSSYGTPPTQTTTVTLNANGQGSVYLNSVSSASISSISGSIVYWI